MKKLIHTPEGVRDIYGRECLRKHYIQEQMKRTFASFGYESIETPTFEFFDVFSKEIGTTPSKELYKFFDKEGNTLVLRPDFTPSIGRSAAKYFVESDRPVRLTYMGNTFTNSSNLQGKLKEVTQMGAELIGDASVMADAEMVHLAVATLKAAGLKEFQISVGEIGFFRGFCQETGIDADTEEALRECISDKNYFGAEDLLTSLDMPKEKIQSFLKMTELFGSYEVLDEAAELVNNDRSRAAIARLKEVYELLKLYGDEKYVSFDLGLISRYHYYTGIIFKGYTYGVGDAIATGGRYDNLLSYFGKDSVSIGFVVYVDEILKALAACKLSVPLPQKATMVLYLEDSKAQAIRYVEEARNLGTPCLLWQAEVDEKESNKTYVSYAKEQGHAGVVFVTKKGIKKLL